MAWEQGCQPTPGRHGSPQQTAKNSCASSLVAPDSGVPQDIIKDELGEVAIGGPCLLHGIGRGGAPQDIQQVHKLQQLAKVLVGDL